PTLDQPDGLQLEFQCVPRPSYRIAHFSLLKLIFTYQLRSTFFRGKVIASGLAAIARINDVDPQDEGGESTFIGKYNLT
ncbi:hypothetical protein, partial [Limnohabitans sp.]|uniref:hypothetical protein n=1 Tax=Limnohabitans sp. TaxID=1907725 RepID=UPI00286F16B2